MTNSDPKYNFIKDMYWNQEAIIRVENTMGRRTSKARSSARVCLLTRFGLTIL